MKVTNAKPKKSPNWNLCKLCIEDLPGHSAKTWIYATTQVHWRLLFPKQQEHCLLLFLPKFCTKVLQCARQVFEFHTIVRNQNDFLKNAAPIHWVVNAVLCYVAPMFRIEASPRCQTWDEQCARKTCEIITRVRFNTTFYLLARFWI